MTDRFDLFAATDAFVSRQKFKPPRNKFFYPSEVSVTYTDSFGDRVTEGGCLRAIFFRLQGKEKPLPNSARSEWVFKQGIATEAFLINTWKEMGIWVGNNVKYFDEKHHISGEMDVLLRNPDGSVFIGEVKSFWGYQAKKKLFGNKSTKASPKLPQLLQLLLYLDFFHPQFPYGELIYFARDTTDRKTFHAELLHENGKTHAVVDGEVYRHFSMDDVYARYARLGEYLKSGTVPPADYELFYSDERVIHEHEKGNVAKTTWEKFEKKKLKRKERPGDWNCRYCSYRHVCFGKSAINILED